MADTAKPQSGINADRIKMTVRVDKELYQWLHNYCTERGAVHNQIMLIALKWFKETHTTNTSKLRLAK